VHVQSRASKLSFTDILKRLATTPETDPTFISKKVNLHCLTLASTIPNPTQSFFHSCLQLLVSAEEALFRYSQQADTPQLWELERAAYGRSKKAALSTK